MPTSFEVGFRSFDRRVAENLMMFGHAQDLDSYITYLRDTVKLPAMDVQLNGGAQFRRPLPVGRVKMAETKQIQAVFPLLRRCLLRLMYEVEVFTRFAGLGKRLEPVDVIQARCLYYVQYY